MSAKQLAEEIERLILSAGERFAGTITTVQDKLYASLVRILKDLDLDGEGNIRQSAENRRVLRDSQAAFDEVIRNSPYQKGIEANLAVISKINKLNSEYFKGISESITFNRNFIKDLQRQTIEKINTTLLQDGLISNVKAPLNDILGTNINTGGKYSGLLEQLRNYIKGTDELDGRLLSYSNGFLRDTLFQYSRAFQESMTADLKLDWYLYAGGLMDTSREFCIHRAGKFFSRGEIETWPQEDWKGKYRGTTVSNIFYVCGGYNCTHSLIPVSDIIVPEKDKQDAKDKGYVA